MAAYSLNLVPKCIRPLRCYMNNLMKISISEELKKSLVILGRTEDVKFSPDERRLAIAGFTKNKILLIDVNIEFFGSDKQVTLTEYTEITSPNLRKPHGLSFANNETLIVANREGDVLVLGLPPREAGVKEVELHPLETIASDSIHYIYTPGSVSASQIGLDLYEILICNNYANYVTRHILDGRNQFRVISSAVLLKNGMEIPDSIAMSNKKKWIAISNHNTNSVFLFENTQKLNSQSSPDGILSKINYPHGVRFTSDDNFILVADAGAPYVHVYSKVDDSWAGEHDPIISIRVMDDETYLRGRYDPQEGGPKGIDVDSNMRVIITTSEHQALAFFDLEKVLKELESKTFIPSTDNFDKYKLDQAEEHKNQLRKDKLSHNAEYERTILICELERENYLHSVQEASLKASYDREIQAIHQSRSWKITAPLRWVNRKLNL